MDQHHQPAVIATCPHCSQPLYENAPVSTVPGPLQHVACAVDQDRHEDPALHRV